MEYGLIGLLLFCIILIVVIIKLNKDKNRLNNSLNKVKGARKGELKQYFEEEVREYQKQKELEKQNIKIETESEIKEIRYKSLNQITELENKVNSLKSELKEKEKRYNEVNQDLELYRKGKIEEIDKAAKSEEQRQKLLVDRSVDTYRDLQIDKANEILLKLLEAKELKEKEIEKIQNELEIERSKRAAINEEILRQRAIDEQQDFYRIQLKEEDKQDIEILRSIIYRLRYPEAINKAIWTTYYQKPLAELRKRLLPNGDISGIYKITRIKTGEIYIGQTTSIDKRWQEHTKTALGVGNLTSSQLHRVMREDGPENFTFEVLEETPKDKLKEREAFYINFYDSKTYGLNTIKGQSK